MLALIIPSTIRMTTSKLPQGFLGQLGAVLFFYMDFLAGVAKILDLILKDTFFGNSKLMQWLVAVFMEALIFKAVWGTVKGLIPLG